MSLKFKIEFNVLNHLGIGLYSSTPAVVTEIISNAWDADASNVNIILNPDNDVIVIEDDGHGMSEDDVSNKFLKVGYSRRVKEATDFSRSGKRRVMGRKGIGKLAMFSLANTIEVVTRAKGSEAVAFLIDVQKLRAEAASTEEAIDYPVEPIAIPADFVRESGTRISLRNLNTKINKTEKFLRPRIARRFGVFGDEFRVSLNSHLIGRKDAEFYEDIQFVWYFDKQSMIDVAHIATNIAVVPDATKAGLSSTSSPPPPVAAAPASITVTPGQAAAAKVSASASGTITKVPERFTQQLQDRITLESGDVVVRGFVATVDTPSKLGKGEESLNKIAVFANGRLFQEDILSELGDARYFNSYIVGEVHADFLDQDKIDRATASRESIKHDDEKFQALRAHLKSVLATIRDQWDDWRRTLGYVKSVEANPAISAWIASFKNPLERKAADRLMTSIANLKVSNDDGANKAAKTLLYKSSVVGFEKLRARQQLDQLENITDVLSPEFAAIFSSLDDIEESYYLDITRSRLEVIRKFKEEIVDQGKLEKVAQNYLFTHLWLLDPSWDRVSGTESMEVTMTAELKKACPDETSGARLDIAYRTTAGRHLIIELKRPQLYVSANALELQGRKYVEAMQQYYTDHPDVDKLNGRLPAIDVFFLVSTRPDMNSHQEQVFGVYNMKVLTYTGLIENALRAYQDYLGVKARVSQIDEVLKAI